MESYLTEAHYDLITPDGKVVEISNKTKSSLEVLAVIEKISEAFVGFRIDPSLVLFNLKSTLAQMGIHTELKSLILKKVEKSAEIHLKLITYGSYGQIFLDHLETGSYIGKLFAKDPKRRVRDPDYLLRMFGRKDRDGLPLLYFGHGDKLSLEKLNDHTVAFLTLKNGIIEYDKDFDGVIPTIAKALQNPKIKTRELLKLHQKWVPNQKKIIKEKDILLVKTLPLHIRTAFAYVVDDLLPKGVIHTSANVLEPTTKASGDIYELCGKTEEEITQIPLEFYTLEPHREHVFFSDRDQLQIALENEATIFKTFETAPKDLQQRCSIFVVKGEQLLKLQEKDWISRTTEEKKFPGLLDLKLQSEMVQEDIEDEPSYPFLKAIENGLITSQGVLFCRYFPSPLMKKMLLGDLVQLNLKGIYFERPSYKHADFFSHEDRSLLLDLSNFAIPIYWADRTCGKVLQYTPKLGKDTGMFVPLDQVETFAKSTAFGVYGSTLVKLHFEEELTEILSGILKFKETLNHPLLNKETPLSLVTGGGPGVMEVGNRVAKKLGILSCADIVDFRGSEQEQNPYIEAKMTFRLDKLVERQGEFNLDFPIFLMGGFGTDFEMALETIRRKVSAKDPTPVLLLGSYEYWKSKITSPFQTNLKSGTIAGSEWVSNCFYVIDTAKKGLSVYERFFNGTLPIGKDGPISEEGFFVVN